MNIRRSTESLVEEPARDTIIVERRDGLWRMIVYPNDVQIFRSRELAEAHAQEVACSRVPAWTVIIREPQPD